MLSIDSITGVTSKLMKGKEVADVLQVSKAFAYRLMASGEIPTVRLGRAVRVRPEDLSRFLEDAVHPKSDGWLTTRQPDNVADHQVGE